MEARQLSTDQLYSTLLPARAATCLLASSLALGEEPPVATQLWQQLLERPALAPPAAPEEEKPAPESQAAWDSVGMFVKAADAQQRYAYAMYGTRPRPLHVDRAVAFGRLRWPAVENFAEPTEHRLMQRYSAESVPVVEETGPLFVYHNDHDLRCTDLASPALPYPSLAESRWLAVCPAVIVQTSRGWWLLTRAENSVLGQAFEAQFNIVLRRLAKMLLANKKSGVDLSHGPRNDLEVVSLQRYLQAARRLLHRFGVSIHFHERDRGPSFIALDAAKQRELDRLVELAIARPETGIWQKINQGEEIKAQPYNPHVEDPFPLDVANLVPPLVHRVTFIQRPAAGRIFDEPFLREQLEAAVQQGRAQLALRRGDPASVYFHMHNARHTLFFASRRRVGFVSQGPRICNEEMADRQMLQIAGFLREVSESESHQEPSRARPAPDLETDLSAAFQDVEVDEFGETPEEQLIAQQTAATSRKSARSSSRVARTFRITAFGDLLFPIGLANAGVRTLRSVISRGFSLADLKLDAVDLATIESDEVSEDLLASYALAPHAHRATFVYRATGERVCVTSSGRLKFSRLASFERLRPLFETAYMAFWTLLNQRALFA